MCVFYLRQNTINFVSLQEGMLEQLHKFLIQYAYRTTTSPQIKTNFSVL